MSNFKLTDFKVRGEAAKPERITVTELDSNVELHVDNFNVGSFKKSGVNNYSEIREKFGPLAVTDPARAVRNQKDRRFSLNPLLRDPLSVEQEENRAIDDRISVLVEYLAMEAKKVAEEEGYKAGLQKGSEETISRVQGQADESLKKFQELVREMETARIDVFRENEKFLINLIFRIAKMVTLKELATDQEYLIRLTKDLVENVGAQDNTILKINSEDEKFINAIRENLFKSFGEMRNLNIEVSSKIPRGGCRIETEWSAIEVNIDEQFRRIEEALLGKDIVGKQ